MEVYFQDVYFPQEDSFLMLEAIRHIAKKGMKVLDLGTGSGILAFEAAKIAKHIDAVDINRSALEFVKEQIKALNFKNINVFKSNLFSNVKGKYDLILFNPPYLPEGNEKLEAWLRNSIIGGKQGNEIIIKFLKQAKNFLTKHGKILFCCSSLSNKEAIEKILKEEDYNFDIIARKKLFFEELYVYLASKND